MRARLFLFFCTFFITIPVFAQIDSVFRVSREILTDSIRTSIEVLKKHSAPFYEDERYLVSQTCSGEWGGTIKFKNKKSGVEYSCSASCPVSVNKLDGKYYVTSSLAHMSGSCEVLEISNPDLMEVYKAAPFRRIKGKKVKYVGDDESKSTQGTVKLISAYGKRILASFIYKGRLFHVVKDRKETYVATIENEEFKSVQTITNEDVFTYDTAILKADTGHMLVPISGGYLRIFADQITILKHG